ncbi:MAG TPA: hypothetical protein DCL62_06960 [Kandleria vitulina]|nr:hypothetical protein [Kandleria vitulina]
MTFQKTNTHREKMQNEILDLEKKYFEILKKVLLSDSFTDDLLTIEKEIRENYQKFKKTWNLKNKLKVPAERLVWHHAYTQLQNIITGIYPSPISPDLGIMTDDCILCIDVKTIDTIGNSIDINSTQVEPNQISFSNTYHNYFSTVSNLQSIDQYSNRPVLTYVIKFIYTDDNYSFKLSRENKPTIVLACIPNGELSELFDHDIIKNFKTYNYYTEQDHPEFKTHYIPSQYTDKKSQKKYTEDYCVRKRNFQHITIGTGKQKKDVYFDAVHRALWWLTSYQNKPAIRAIKSGSTARLNNDILKKRFDSKNHEWVGYLESTISQIKF